MTNLWVIGGGIESIPGLQVAKKMGLTVILSDANGEAPGISLADYFFKADTYSASETINCMNQFISKSNKIHGVIALAADVPETLASTSTYLGLVGQSIETSVNVSNKYLMKQVLREAGVLVPDFWKIETIDSLVDNLCGGKKYVLKPVDSRGARGVLLIDSDTDLKWAFEESIKHSPSGCLILEEYLDGPQISTESLVQNGSLYHVGFADRNYDKLEQFQPHIIEDGGSQPSMLSPKIRKSIFEMAGKAGSALGLETGVLKGDMVWHQEKPFVIEVATRLSGGWFSSVQIPSSTKISFVELAIRQSLGENISTFFEKRVKYMPVASRYVFVESGTLLPEPSEVALPKSGSIVFTKLLYDKPMISENITKHNQRIGVVIAKGLTRKRAIKNANKQVGRLKSQLLKNCKNGQSAILKDKRVE
jgi:biotin carboxylase